MRFFIRNKTKYDPSLAFNDVMIAVDVDHTQEIGKIKEEVRKIAKGCKITALYVARQDGSFIDLADDRTINFYNLQDGMILETTSNPFWVTTLYSNMKRREQEAATNPEDVKLCAQAQQSFIHRCMAIGLLLNGTGETEKQPATFDSVDDLYEYCYTQGKKPAHMSRFTLDELQEMHYTFQEELQHKTDPIGAFIHLQAVKLGYLQEDNGIDANDPFRSHFQQNAGQQRDAAAARQNDRQNRNAAPAGRRRRANVCMCDDCEVAMATSYCADCNPPLRLCDNCWNALHRGATRRNHQRRDLSEAPRQTSYVPQAYRAPFAMLIAFHRASQEIPQKLSLTAEEIKTRGHPFTDTDLEEAKQRGKPFSGFDSLENALIKNDIVLKEASRIPKYSLQQSGQGLALKCSNFDYAVQTLLQGAAVPTVPAPDRRPVLNNRQVCLLVDIEEPQKDRFIKVAQDRGLFVKVRKLPTGDFCWILLPPGAQVHDAADVPDQELVLPYLVERKTWGDLWTSVRSPRFENQVQRMKSSGIKHLFYVVEGSPKDIPGRPGVEVETFLQGKLDRLLLEDKFFVNRTPSWIKTVEWVCHLTNLATEFQHTDRERNFMTFAEFSRNALNHLRVNGNRKTRPTNGIVWSDGQFADNITSHHKGEGDIGRILDQTHQLSDSILVIQGLTAYNTTCHGLYKRTLADYLQMPGQTAEECVQLHLEDSTHQLVSINVFQYYTLYLEVFKGVRIYRTETQQETQEFLSRFDAQDNKVVGTPAINGIKHNFDDDQPRQDAARRIETDMMFANDSQEEEHMLQQALQQSLAEDDIPQTESTASDTAVDMYKEDGSSSSNLYAPAPTGTNNKGSKTDPNNNTGIHRNDYSTSTNSTAEVKQELSEDENDLQSVLQFKLYDQLQEQIQEDSCRSGTFSHQKESNNEELENVLEQSRLLYETKEKGGSQCISIRHSLADNNRQIDDNMESKGDSEDEQLQRVLQESKIQYGMVNRALGDGIGNTGVRADSVSTEEHHASKNDSENELLKALEESRLQYERLQYKKIDDLGKNEFSGDSRKEDKQESKSDSDEELQKALEESKLQYEMEQKASKRGNDLGNSGVVEDSNTVQRHKSTYNTVGDLQKVLQESKPQYEMKEMESGRMDERKKCGNGKDQVDDEDKVLKQVLRDSRREMESGRMDERKKCGNGKDQVDDEDKVLKQVLRDSRREMESGRMDERKKCGNGKDQVDDEDKVLKQVLRDSRREMESGRMDEMKRNGNGKDQVDDEDRALRQVLGNSRKEIESGRMDERKSSGNANDQNDEDRALTQVLGDSRKEMKSGGIEGKMNSGKTKDQDHDEDKTSRQVLNVRGKQMESEKTEGKKLRNGNASDQNGDFPDSGSEAYVIDSQEDNNLDHDFIYDFEIPDFANDENSTTDNALSNQDHDTSTPKTSSSMVTATSSYSTNNSSHSTTGVASSKRSSSSTDDVGLTSTSHSVDTSDCKVVTPDTKEKDETAEISKQSRGVDDASAYSSSNIDAIYIDSQDNNDDDNDDDDDNHDDDVITWGHDIPSDDKHCNSIFKEKNSPSSYHIDDAILIDSQDDIEDIDSANDYEIARQLQEEFNHKTAEHTKKNENIHSVSTPNNREHVGIQIDSYREEQKKRFCDSKTGKGAARKDPGLVFRQKAEAIARGKVSFLSSTKEQGSNFDSSRRHPKKRGSDGVVKNASHSFKHSSLNTTTISTQNGTTRKSCNTTSSAFPKSHSTPNRHTESSLSAISLTSSPSKKARKPSNSTSLVFPPSHSTPSHSESSFGLGQSSSFSDSSRNSTSLVFPQSSPSPSVNATRTSTSTNFGSFTFPSSSPCSSHSGTTSDDRVHGFVFPSSSSSASPRVSESTKESFKPSKAASVPKCSDCGETGHRKGTKRCPYYYTEEAQSKREEQTRKRKEKRDEEDREQQVKVDALVAEQSEMADRAEQLRIQIERFNQQNNNLPKMVEDAMKCLKKKRRK